MHSNRTQTTLFLRGQNRFASQFSANHIQFRIAKLRFCIANCDAIPDKFIPVLDNHKDYIDARDTNGFLSSFPFKPAKFHLLPMLHKIFTTNGQLKCRPIISSIGYCTSPASRYVDYHRKQHVCKAQTVLSNKLQVINKLQKQVSFQDSRFLTADGESLYTKIIMSWIHTVDALHAFLEETKHPLTSLLIDLVNFILRNN